VCRVFYLLRRVGAKFDAAGSNRAQQASDEGDSLRPGRFGRVAGGSAEVRMARHFGACVGSARHLRMLCRRTMQMVVNRTEIVRHAASVFIAGKEKGARRRLQYAAACQTS